MAGRVRKLRDHVAAVAVRLISFFVVNNRNICSLTFLSSMFFFYLFLQSQLTSEFILMISN